MDGVILIFLILIVYLDARLLRGFYPSIFKHIFRPSLKIWIPILIFLPLFFGQEDYLGLLTFFFFIYLLPLYLLRRERLGLCLESSRLPFLLAPESTPWFYFSEALKNILLWAFVTVGLEILIPFVLSFILPETNELMEILLVSFLSSIFFLYLIFRSIRQSSGHDFLTYTGLRKAGLSFWKGVFIPFVLGLFFAYTAASLGVQRGIQPRTPLNEVLESATSSSLIVIFLLLAVVFAPLIEEIIFRGYFFRAISGVKGTRVALYLVAFAFGFLHVGQYWTDWVAISMVGILGFSLTILRALSGSTIPSVIMHYVYNGAVTIFVLILLNLTNPSYFEYLMNSTELEGANKEQLLLESIKKQPHLIDAYNELARLYAQEDRNLNQALRLIESALDVEPDLNEFLDTKADILAKMSRFQEAKGIREGLLKKNLSDRMRKHEFEKIKELDQWMALPAP